MDAASHASDFDAQALSARTPLVAASATEARRTATANDIPSLVADVLAFRGGSDASSWASYASSCRALCQIFAQYREQPELLDPQLEASLGAAMARVRNLVHEAHGVAFADDCEARDNDVAENVDVAGGCSPMAIMLPLCRVVQCVCEVRGAKVALRFFPHDITDFSPATGILARLGKMAIRQNASDASDGNGVWEARVVMLLWLQVLVLVPFDFSTLNPAKIVAPHAIPAPSGCEWGTAKGALATTLLDACAQHLRDPSPARGAAAELLAKLLVRVDISGADAMPAFVDWACAHLDHADAPDHRFLVPGVLRALCCFLEPGAAASTTTLRAAVLALGRVVGAVERLCEPAQGDYVHLARTLGVATRKLLVKTIQRCALTMLPVRKVRWRYRGAHAANLLDNLAADGRRRDASPEAAANAVAAKKPADVSVGEAPAPLPDDDGPADWPPNDRLAATYECVERACDVLLDALRDADTVVRWSAAKGVGRITSRLPLVLATDVVTGLLAQLEASDGDGGWQGGCLALAELARRGLLLPERLSEAAGLTARALHYDVRRGPCSVGAHVRDAAAYVVWSVARAYDPSEVQSVAEYLTPHMLAASLYDREAHVRRAAAAAFQECVGRLGAELFPGGLAVLEHVHYFKLGDRSRAYLVEAPRVLAAMPQHVRHLLSHVAETKLCHWDASVRKLAADALRVACMTGGSRDAAARHVASTILPVLLDQTLSTTLEVRHGAALGVAEVLLGLHDASRRGAEQQDGEPLLTDALAERVARCVPDIEKKRLYRGKGGEIMRGAVCRMIECIARVELPLPKPVSKALLVSLDENLKHPNATIQASAGAALEAYASSYLPPDSDAACERTVRRHCAALEPGKGRDPNPAARRGAALALGHLSGGLLSLGPASRVITCLAQAASKVEENVDDRDPETRRNAAAALSRVCVRLGDLADDSLLRDAASALMSCTRDYSVDNRGDVGSWVRRVAMESLIVVHRLIAERETSSDPAFADAAVCALLLQCTDRINKVRDTAGRSLRSMLLHDNPPIAASGRSIALDAGMFDGGVGGVVTPDGDGAGAGDGDGVVPEPEAEDESNGNEDVPDDASDGDCPVLPPQQRDAVNWAAPVEAIPRLMALLPVPAYQRAFVRGLVVAAGSSGDSFAKYMRDTLLEACKRGDGGLSMCAVVEDAVAVLRDAADAAKAAKDAKEAAKSADNLDDVSVDDVDGPSYSVGEAARLRLERHAVPALRFLEHVLLKNQRTLPETVANDALLASRGCIKGLTRDAHVQLAGANVLIQLSTSTHAEVASGALASLLGLLVHGMPRVRRHAAEQLYVRLGDAADDAEMDDDDDTANRLREASDAVGGVRWDNGTVADAKANRAPLYAMLRIEPPTVVKAATTAAKKPKVADDELAYQSLVNEAGY
ncbi:hypothetical protein PPROV_000326100 [Pycnococcus provasolii]|uniref:Tubulin-specific chaperone D n=1 Tax=Pycnococcus provasolii TaxID=41880 RepID=A0A830HHH9_9CHLO|nr:hypothetical protein PPROV_000326100 [Pycnococcus provasolii]